MTRPPILSFRLGFFLAVIVIAYFAITPFDYPVPELTGISDKLDHMVAFYVLALGMDFSFPERGSGFSKALALLSYGLLLEIGQIFLAYRSASLFDVLANGLGIAMYTLSLLLVRRVPLLNLRLRLGWRRIKKLSVKAGTSQ